MIVTEEGIYIIRICYLIQAKSCRDHSSGDTIEAIHPQTKLAAGLSDQLAKIESQFGMTPSSRTGLTIRTKDTASEKPRSRFFRDDAG